MAGVFSKLTSREESDGEIDGVPADEYAFGFLAGVPIVAAKPQQLTATVARSGAADAVSTLFPAGSRAGVVANKYGFYFRVLVPRPHALPDVIPVPT